MTQDPEHQLSKCPKCGAGKGQPCTTGDGREALKVHYGRPYWSSRVLRPWQRIRELEEEDLPTGREGWGPCEQCAHWMLLAPGLPTACVVCRGAA